MPATGDPEQEWNHDTRKYTEWENGAVKEGFPRDYTPEENELADVILAQEAKNNNEGAVQISLGTYFVELNTFIKDTSNPTINQNPASYMKFLARILRLLVRVALHRFDGTD